MANILIVDDEEKIRYLLGIMLQRQGHRVDQAGNGAAALSKIEDIPFDLVISDIKMPEMSGPKLLTEMKQRDINCPVVFITAFATVESAVEMMKMGAADYITKPFEEERIQVSVARSLNLSRIMAENRELKKGLQLEVGKDEIVCVSQPMKDVLEMASRVATSDSAVLITGESGTGKELMARFIHNGSSRNNERFVPLNCAAISPQLIESELFGYEKGAFTGANQRTQGKFEFAHKGTIFLDEIGDLSPDAQAKLLRALQEKSIRRVGGNSEIPIDTRVICATNQKLETMVEEGRFRQDLFFRINVFPLVMPPLRGRKEDIIPLCEHFLTRTSKGRSISLTDGAKRKLSGYMWPGNVRELANAVERALIFAPDHGGITAETLSFLDNTACISPDGTGFTLPPEGIDLEKVEQELVRQALDAADNNQMMAARLLGLTRGKFRVLMKSIKVSE